jgi:integrase
MGLFRRGTTWWVSFTDSKGKRVRQSAQTNSKTEAQAILASLQTKVREGKFFDISQEPTVYFRDLLARVGEHQRNLGRRSYESHFLSYSKSLLGAFGHLTLKEITIEKVQAYQMQRAKTVKPATANRSLAILRRTFNLGIRWGLVKENPVAKVDLFPESRGRMRFLSREEQQSLLDCCSKRLRDVVLVALRTGMRRGELLGLRKQDLDFNRGLIILTKTKTDRGRQVPMTDEVKTVLARLAFGRQDDEHIFRNRWNGPYQQPRAEFVKAMGKAGIKDFRFHDLRHTYASDLVMAGVDIFTVSKLLGHSNVKTTMIYAHLSPDHAKHEMAKYQQYLAKTADTKVSQSLEAAG